ncbi:hypothetical protein GEMRC1_009409 [Eukaryota sp. GEM-RC1]
MTCVSDLGLIVIGQKSNEPLLIGHNFDADPIIDCADPDYEATVSDGVFAALSSGVFTWQGQNHHITIALSSSGTVSFYSVLLPSKLHENIKLEAAKEEVDIGRDLKPDDLEKGFEQSQVSSDSTPSVPNFGKPSSFFPSVSSPSLVQPKHSFSKSPTKSNPIDLFSSSRPIVSREDMGKVKRGERAAQKEEHVRKHLQEMYSKLHLTKRIKKFSQMVDGSNVDQKFDLFLTS